MTRRPRSLPAPALAAGLLAAAGARGQSAGPAVFVANNVSDEVTSFRMSADGTLVLVGSTPASDGPIAAAIAPGGAHLAVAHGTENEVSEALQIFAVAADATLAPVLTAFVPDAPLAVVWLADDVVAVTETGTGATDLVHTFRFDAGGPALTPVDTAEGGGFTSRLGLHPRLPLLYAQDSVGDRVIWYGYDPGGAIDVAGSVSTAPTFPLELALTPDGAMLYAAGGISSGGHAVVGLRLDDEGSATAHPASPFFSPGQSPAHVAVTGDGALLFVGHGTDATVRSFFVEPDGAIVATGASYDVGLQGTIGDVAVLGEFLLVTDESTAIDGVAGLYSFRVFPDGTFAAVAPIYETGGVRPETIVAWDPRLIGDLDGDGRVGTADLLILLSLWGHEFSVADLDRDGVVGFSDLLILLAAWTG